ncbi:hypothetical protein TrVFT333_010562 [Trichoderma virens FT-333]|nr:hypothetical protein TrVFT333_010562 [Trichoderma virens FT-333]
MLHSLLYLAKDILNTHSIAINIDIDVSTSNMKHCYYFLYIVGNFQGMDITRGLESVAVLLRPPRMLKIVPSTLEYRGVHRTGMSMSRQYARLTDSEDVDQVW